MKILNEEKITQKIEKAERVLPVINELFSLLRSEGIEPAMDHIPGFIAGGPSFVLKEKDLAYRRRGRSSFTFIEGEKEKRFLELREQLILPMNDANLQIADLAFEDGKVSLADEYKRKAEDMYTYFLDTPEKVKFWKQLNAVAKSLNQMEKLSKDLGKPSICRELNRNPFTCLKVQYSDEYLQFSPDPEIFNNDWNPEAR